MALAGVLHLYIAPTHFAHAPAHGLFFGVIGVAQLAWLIAYLRAPNQWTFGVGYALSGGVVVVWLLTQLVSTPYALAPEPIDWETLVSKCAEFGTFMLLAVQRYETALSSQLRMALSPVVAVVGGLVFWGSGHLGEVLAPQLGHQETEEHGHASGTPAVHSHGDEDEGGLTLVQWWGQTFGTTPADYAWDLPPGFPPPRVPEDNPMTPAKVELGRHLFYDTRLSGNGTQSCASCHFQEKAFSDGRRLAVGSTGEVHPRNSMSLTNVAYNATLTWSNSALVTFEKQFHVPIFGEDPIELGVAGHEDEVLTRFREDPLYQELFAEAYPSERDAVNMGNIIRALASFNRTLISGDSPYDRFVYQQDMDALSESARRGLELVLSEDLECHHCHGGFNFTTSTVHANTRFFEAPFHNTGLYNVDGEGAYPPQNQGLYEVTGNIEDMGRFRAPTLRNIALTAPYMHDGSMATLEEVIAFYERGGRLLEDGPLAGDGSISPYKSGFVGGFTLTDQQRNDLLTFLNTLTDSTFITDPRFSNPFLSAQR